MSDDFWDIAPILALVAFAAIIFGSMFAYFAYDSSQQAKIGKACVAAGSSWVQVSDGYECRVNPR